MTLHRKAAVTGIGETKYSKGSGMSDRELQLQLWNGPSPMPASIGTR